MRDSPAMQIPGERTLRQGGYLSDHRCQSETLVSLTGIRGQAQRRRKEKPHHGNLEQLRTQVSLKLASPMCVGSGRGMGKSRGKTHKLARYSVCSKQPKALLKIFPLRACSFLNVVIMQNVFLPLFPHSLPVCLLQTSTAATETFENLEESPTQLCRSIAVRGPVDSPSFPGLDTHSEYSRAPSTTPLDLPSHQVSGKQLPIKIMLVNQSLYKNEQMLPSTVL